MTKTHTLLLGITALAASATTLLAQDVKLEINWKQDRQSIDGFGACAREPEAEVWRSYPEPVRNKVADLLFSPEKGIGLSFTRVSIETGKDGTDPSAEGYRISTQWPSFQPEPGVYDWESQNPLGNFLKHAKSVFPGMKYYASCWSPPYWMKTNQRAVKGGRLKEEHYGDFAKFVAEWIKGYQERYGIAFSGISPWNEPDRGAPWPSANWSGAEQEKFIRTALGPALKEHGLASVGAVPGEHGAGEWRDVDTVLANPETAALVTAVAAHQYGSVKQHGKAWFSPYPRAVELGKRVWMTETCFGGRGGYKDDINIGMEMATRMTRTLAQGDFNAFMLWRFLAWARPSAKEEPRVMDKHDRENLMWARPDGTVDLSIKYHVMGQFSKFIRPGYVRVDAPADPAPNVWTAAFRSPDRKRIVIVAVNAGAAPVNLNVSCAFDGEEIDAIQRVRTSASERMADLGGLMSADGKTFTDSLPAQSITTFHTALETN